MTVLRKDGSPEKQYRSDQKSSGRMPDFLIIGAMKSGTTSLFEALERHPHVYAPQWKELQYFSRDHMFNRGEDFYRDNFVEARDDQIIGEGSTCYSRWPYYPHAAERIFERLPNIRLIYIMRHPVERAYSHYGHLMQERMVEKKGPILTFEEALEEEKEIIDTSLYMMQIERYLSLFHREQLLLLTLDEFKTSPEALLKRTQHFLGLDPIDLISQRTVHANKWGAKMAEERIRGVVGNIQGLYGLSKILKIVPKGSRQRLKETVIRSKFLNSLFKTGLTKKQEILTPLTPRIRQRLLKHFEEPTKQLEMFLDCKLDTWHN